MVACSALTSWLVPMTGCGVNLSCTFIADLSIIGSGGISQSMFVEGKLHGERTIAGALTKKYTILGWLFSADEGTCDCSVVE